MITTLDIIRNLKSHSPNNLLKFKDFPGEALVYYLDVSTLKNPNSYQIELAPPIEYELEGLEVPNKVLDYFNK